MADGQKVLEFIERAAREGRKELDLSSEQLTSVPRQVTDLNNLTSLNLEDNRLSSLPPEIGGMSKLRFLRLGGNKLLQLPPEIGNLRNLELLDLGLGMITRAGRRSKSNHLRELPLEIGNLTTLKKLDLGGNFFSQLGAELNGLSELQSLILENNDFTFVPKVVCALPNLKSLDLTGNQLTSVPPEISQLTTLIDLYLRDNYLTNLPPEISRLTNLYNLDLSYNQLTSLPLEISQLTKLRNLFLRTNHLTSVPPEIIKLTKVTYIDLRNNQLPIPPETLVDPRNVKAIFASIAGLVSGERLNEAKMLVLGDGKVGKSSMVEQLIYGTFDPKRQSTLGVEIHDEMQVVQSEVTGDGEPVKLNIWDFGGQEIQHSTHQFFLTMRSLYLLVVDARKGEQLSNIEYWLKLIQSFGGDSPIIIVINQIDQLKGARPLNLDRKALQDKYNIKGFVETSCATGEGIPSLKDVIAQQVDQMKHVRDVWPREWSAIKHKLREIKKDYIPIETYEEICAQEKLNDRDLRQSLLGLLHDLGVVICFPGDTQVLNPRWVTQGVYRLLTSTQLVRTLGQFDVKDVGEILDGIPETRGRYPEFTHRRLIDVMQHFELCFEFTDRPGHYLIPRHLHDNELDIPWDDKDALKFQYHYDTLPDSVISRFIVRMNQYITKQYYWKNGVFLHSGENRAKVKADLVDRKIFISVIGKEQTRRAFLAVIRSALDEINSNFKIEIKQMIPVPGFPDELVSYNDLLDLEGMNESEIIVPRLRRKFSVRELLDGVEDLIFRHERRERDLSERMYSKRMSEEIQSKSQRTPLPPKSSPMPSLMSFVLGFVIVLGAIVGAAVAISEWVSVTAAVMTSIIIIGALLAIGVVGAMQLRNDDRLSEENFLKLMVESYKRLPLLRGTGDSDKLLDK